jgi:hypothetical protein
MARFEVDALSSELQSVRTQQLTEAWGDHVDPRGPYNDTPGFGWLSRRLGYFTQGNDRTEGRYAPVYDHELDLKAIRMAAWLMDEEVPVAKAMKNRLVDYTIGSGFDWEVTHPSPRVQAICRRIVSSFMDNSDWTTLERESFKREIVDGEFIAEFVADGPDISMEVREGDHLTEPANSYELEDWKGYTFETCWSFGILTRKGRAAPIAYHVNRDGVGQDWDLIDADRFVHWKRNAPRNAKRGFSDHYTTHKWLKYGADVLGRTAQGTAVQASIAYIVEHAKGTTPKQAQAIASGRNIVVEKDYQTGQYVNKRKIGAGEVIDIPEGAKYHAGLLGSNASMIYIDVMEALFRLSGVVYAFPEHFVTGYAGNNNRASAEEASSPFIQGRFADQGVRKQQMRRLLLNVIKFGLERLPRLGITYEDIEHELNVSIAEPEIVTKDPAALTSALKMQKEMNWISDRMAVNQLGYDFEDVQQQRKEEAGVQPGQQPDSPADKSMAGLSRRQFMNNKKAILDIVRELKAGEIDQGQATVMLAALGLSKGLVDQLLGVHAVTEDWLPEEQPDDDATKTLQYLTDAWQNYP